MQRIALVDDDATVRLATSIFLTANGFLVESFESGNEFLLSDPSDHACILLDIEMPGMNGLAVLRALNELDHVPPVLVLTGSGDIPTAVNAMKLGALDFLEKPYAPALLLEALRCALDRKPLSADSEEGKAARVKVGRLSRRQLQVLSGIIAGRQSKVIAFNLGLSTRTVEAYRAELMSRLEVRSISEVVQLGLKAGVSGTLDDAPTRPSES